MLSDKIIIIVYITLFFTLSVVLFFTGLPNRKEYKDYIKSRKLMSGALLSVSVYGVLHTFTHPHYDNPFTNMVVITTISYIFTIISYQSFLYVIETSTASRRNVIKIAVLSLPIYIISIACGYLIPAYSLEAEILAVAVCIIVNFIMLTRCLREFDKFILLINNYYSNFRNIRWMPFCLWMSFITACITSLSFFFEPLTPISGVLAIFTYTFISLKLLKFIPENVHTARQSIERHEIVAIEHNIEVEAEPQDTEIVENGTAAQDERLFRRYEKIATLMEKWVESEKYLAPGINIKEAATQMGTNSNYLSTYINNVLETSFANWLNSLRIEKSKEYLCSQEKYTIEECGIKVGYETLYNYSRWFKAITGVSPSEWRRKNR